MSPPLTDLEIEALKLPLEERVRLADRLLASVYGDQEVDEAWALEIERRLAIIDAGGPLIAAESALKRARRSIA